MEFLRKLRWMFYPTVFFLVFFFTVYFSFPMEKVEEIAEASISNIARQIGPRTSTPPTVDIKKISLWRLSGVHVANLTIVWPPGIESQSMTLALDTFKARLGVFALLFGNRDIYSQAEIFGGEVESDISLKKNGSIKTIHSKVDKLNLKKINFAQQLLGAPIEGVLDLLVDINANSELRKDGEGKINLSLQKVVMGPGNLKLPSGGFMSSINVPKIDLGQLNAQLEMSKGQLRSKVLSLGGGDVQADMNLDIGLGPRTALSRINGSGWFSVKKEFIEKNETIKMLFDLLPELKAAQLGDGKVGFSIKGSLSRPRFSLERYMGKKPATKTRKVAGKN